MGNKVEYSGRTKKRQTGEIYQVKVKVLKEKKGVPSSVEINGFKYSLNHDGYINGHKSKVAERRKSK